VRNITEITVGTCKDFGVEIYAEGTIFMPSYRNWRSNLSIKVPKSFENMSVFKHLRLNQNYIQVKVKSRLCEANC
jgi:hypothetical protein